MIIFILLDLQTFTSPKTSNLYYSTRSFGIVLITAAHFNRVLYDMENISPVAISFMIHKTLHTIQITIGL